MTRRSPEKPEDPGPRPLLGNMAPVYVGFLLILVGAFIPWPRSPYGCDGQWLAVTEGAASVDLCQWLKEHPVPDSQNIYAVELTRTARSSTSIIQISDREAYHVHRLHDLSVTVFRGKGRILLNGRDLAVEAGDTISIPANVPHAFLNRGGSKRPAAALVVFSPPYDGKDKVQVEEKGASK